jgi:hypothetical protein
MNTRSSVLALGGKNKPTAMGGSKGTDLGGALLKGSERTFISPKANSDASASTEWRVRIGLPPLSKFAYQQQGYAGLTNVLFGVNGTSDFWRSGVVFPYTPTVTITHNARYNEQALIHSNYKNYFYEGSDVAAISIAGIFTCQDASEAEYLMASVQFLRACTKMEFGADNPKAGTPPTLVRLYGYGEHYLPSVNCVVTSVAHTMPEDVDYIKYTIQDGGYGWMPISSTLTVTLQPVVSRKRQGERMLLDDFTRGGFLAGASTRIQQPGGGLL